MRRFACAFTAVVCSGCPNDQGSGALAERSQLILSGELSADAAVVGIAYRSASCEPSPIAIACTATLIAPRVVLTAAHCLGQDPPNAYAIYVGASLDADPMPQVIAVSGGRAHPDFDATTHANDIAALILERDAPAGITPIALHRDPLPDLTGQLARLVGYGIDSITSTATGTRRQGTAQISELGADDLRMTPSPAMSCHGDSGGPVLYGMPEEIIGVTTWGDPACAEFGVAARVDRFLDFIQPILDEASAPPRRAFDPSEPFCSETCASDADCPVETVCFALPGETKHCVYHGLPAGELGDVCTTSNECEDACVAVGDGCRRHVPCMKEPTDHCAPPGDTGCGCRAPARSGVATLLLVLATACGARRSRRSRRRTA